MHNLKKGHPQRVIFELAEGAIALSGLLNAAYHCFFRRQAVVLLAKEAALQGEAVSNIKFFEDHNPSSGLLDLFNPKSTLFELEQLVLLTTQQRYNP